MSIQEVQERLGELHQAVCRDKGRVEIKDGDGRTCVLISKEELECLEQALEILSNTSDVQKIAKTIAAMGDCVGKAPVLAAGRFGRN
jgi:PHD/YefM family antitoxin component YafN of YafNO toxin-antitoxin module